MGPVWNDYNKLLVIFDKPLVKVLSYLHEVAYECWELELSFCGPRANGLSSILWLVMDAPLFSIILSLVSHFEQAHFTLAQTIESLKIGQVLNSLSFEWKLQVSKCQIKQVQALNLSSRVQGALACHVFLMSNILKYVAHLFQYSHLVICKTKLSLPLSGRTTGGKRLSDIFWNTVTQISDYLLGLKPNMWGSGNCLFVVRNRSWD